MLMSFSSTRSSVGVPALGGLRGALFAALRAEVGFQRSGQARRPAARRRRAAAAARRRRGRRLGFGGRLRLGGGFGSGAGFGFGRFGLRGLGVGGLGFGGLSFGGAAAAAADLAGALGRCGFSAGGFSARAAFRRRLFGVLRGRFRGWVSFRWVFRIVPAAGCCLPWLKCFRYCLPNFPHSPATEGRERQRLHAFLADGAQSALLLRLIQLVGLGGYYQVRPAVMLEPPLQIEIFLHPSAAGIQNQAGKHQGLPIVQILLDQNLPLLGEPLGDPGISIAR